MIAKIHLLWPDFRYGHPGKIIKAPLHPIYWYSIPPTAYVSTRSANDNRLG